MSESYRFKRVLLKLSGEALMGDVGYGIDPKVLDSLSEQVKRVRAGGVEIAIVVGGGNIFRGLAASAKGMDRAQGDYIGMLATVMNSLALQEALERHGVFTRVMSAIEMQAIAEPYIRRRAIRHLEKGRVVIFAAGTGNPYFSTDTAAALRSMEIGASLLCKATNVEGVYDKDPKKFPEAVMYRRLDYDRCLSDRIGVMDSTAITLCRENKLPIRVFALLKRGNIKRVLVGEDVGTLVSEDKV